VLDAHTDEAFRNGHSVFGDKLLEGNEEAGLDGNAARDGSAPAVVSTMSEWERSYIHYGVLACKQVARNVEQEGQNIRHHSHEQHELGELMRPPRSLEVAPAVEDCKARDDQSEHILLHHRRQCEYPRIPRH
jgi:hypothetical protein